MKCIQLIKQVNNTELGKGGTHETYILVPQEVDVSEFIEQPFKISDEKLKFIAQYLSDTTVLKNNEEGD